MARWLEERHRENSDTHALEAYLARVTPIIRDSVDRYAVRLRDLDRYSAGILSAPQTVRWLRVRLPKGTTLLDYFLQVGGELRDWLDDLQSGPAERSIGQWRDLIDDVDAYRRFMTRLIHTFGNFETIALVLPGTGPMITDRKVQNCLGEMFAIKRRLIRLLELAYSVRRSWLADASSTSLAFFNPETDLSRLVRGMLAEYMVQADPKRIEEARSRAIQTGRRFVSYRFWRPAAAFRQMAEVEYGPGPKRVPKPRKEYVELRLGQVPTITTDLTRLSWAVKEIFNNAIAATTEIHVSDDGHHLTARPIRKLEGSPPPPPIRISAEPRRYRTRLRRRNGIRLVIEDQGVGIDPDVLPRVTLWGFSTHREWADDDAQSLMAAERLESKQMLIGGKGIGLAFARTTVEELGGQLSLESRSGQGTRVTIDLPAPTM